MIKNIFKSKKFIISLVLVLLILSGYIYSQKDVVTTSTEDMIKPHSHQEAILLYDGRVLITSPAEIYDPNVGKFTTIKKIDKNIVAGEAVLLQNGQVLLVGRYVPQLNRRGEDTRRYSAIYDPQNNTFFKINHLIDYIRLFGTTTLLPNGKVLFTGADPNVDLYCKNSDSSSCYRDILKAEIYDPITRKFTLTDKMDRRIVFHHSILLKNGKVLIIGGKSRRNENNSRYIEPYAELYDYKINKFVPIKNNYKAKFYTSSFTLGNGNILIIGSTHDRGRNPIVELYDAKLNSFRQIKNMNIPRIIPTTVTLKDGRILILGGIPRVGAYSLIQAEIFDPNKEIFNLTGKMNLFGDFSEVREGYTTTLLPSGKVLIAGGAIGQGEFSRVVDDIEIYDPKTGIFTKKKMRSGRVFHTTTLLKGRRVLIVGGKNRQNITLRTAEIYKDK